MIVSRAYFQQTKQEIEKKSKYNDAKANKNRKRVTFQPRDLVWVHLWSFRNCTKLGANHTELVQLMQNFVPRSHVGIFRNERT